MLMFVPLSGPDLATWVRGGTRDVDGFAATAGFLSGFDLTDPNAEETDLTLLEIAALAALLRHGRRLVAVCDVDTTPAEPADFGAVRADAVAWRRVTSLFADDVDGAAMASSILAELGAVDLVAAWDSDAVVPLVEGAELLWHGSSEWERLTH